MECIFLHGFASGPSSTKAKYIGDYLRDKGAIVHVPDLNGANFSNLTLTGQLQIIDGVINKVDRDNSIFLVGSSMGGLLATMAAQKHKEIKALILLAPGFGLNRRWHELVGPDEMRTWQRVGVRDVFHHAHNRNLCLKYDFITDAELHQTDALKVSVPTLVIHGRNDEVVPVNESELFKDLNEPIVELHVINSDHGLIDVLPEITDLIGKFLDRHLLEP